MRLRQGIADIRFRRLMDDDGEAHPASRIEATADEDGTIRWTMKIMSGIVDKAINVETTVANAPISSSAENLANKMDASVIVGIID